MICLLAVMVMTEELNIIEKILRHLGLWDIRNHDPPNSASSDNIPELVYDYSDSQIPAFGYWNLFFHCFHTVFFDLFNKNFHQGRVKMISFNLFKDIKSLFHVSARPV